jgi:cobalt-zinc-cadmium efflux system protein
MTPGDGGHDHGGGHSHGTSDLGRRRLAMVLGISGSILLVEVIGAVVSGSLALLADAGHMLTDVGGLVLALVAAAFARRPATTARTWGYRRAEVLAAAAQAAVLLTVGILVLVFAVRRLIDPAPVTGTAMIVFGVVGLVGNSISVALLAGSSGESMNTRAALLEVFNDALGALAVLVAAVVITTTGWVRADPLASLLIGGLILPRTWKLLRETIDVLLEATPKGVDLDAVRDHLLSVEHVSDVHDLHASLVATGLPVLSAHLIVDDSCFLDGHVPALLDDVQDCLVGHFDVRHSTFQFEPVGHLDHERACVDGAVPVASHTDH